MLKKSSILKIVITSLLLVLMSCTLVSGESPQYGGTLKVADPEIQPSLDPHHDMGFGGIELFPPYNTLITYNHNLEFAPELASKWEISEDNKTYVFHLRDDVKFHDGSEFDAEAVKWNIERMMSDYSQVKSRFNLVENVTIEDKYTVKITLKETFAPFLDTLASVGYMVSPKAVAEMGNKAIQKHPVGTGPFKFEELDKQKGRIVFAKNENYFKENKPYLDKIVIEELPEGQTRVFALKNGNSNYLNMVPSNSVSSLKENNKFKLVELQGKSNTIDYINFNCAKEPFNDKRVRLAVAYALDQEKIVQFLDNTVSLTGPLPKSNWGNNPNLKPLNHNLQKSRKLLEEAGYSDGLKITMKIWNNDQVRKDLSLIVKDMLSQVGIEVEIVVLESPTLFQQIGEGKFEMSSLHWGGGGAIDPYGTLYVTFHSESGSNWVVNYNNEKVDSLLNEAVKTVDRKKRKKLYQRVEKIVYNDKPQIWFGKFVTYAAYTKDVNGIDSLAPTGYNPVYENIWLEKN